jgi:hypothetical protein
MPGMQSAGTRIGMSKKSREEKDKHFSQCSSVERMRSHRFCELFNFYCTLAYMRGRRPSALV